MWILEKTACTFYATGGRNVIIWKQPGLRVCAHTCVCVITYVQEIHWGIKTAQDWKWPNRHCQILVIQKNIKKLLKRIRLCTAQLPRFIFSEKR